LPANTRLYKAVQQSGLIVECAPSKAHNMAGWCRQWATYRYGKELSKDAADWLLELAGPEYGVLDQELQKLSTFVGDAGAIGFEVVQRLTAGAGDDKAFKILDAALDGNCAEALVLLERQLAAGDPPQRLLNIASSQVRKLTRAARMAVAKSHSLPQALAAAGVPPFAIERSAARLKRLGRERMAEMFRRLLAADLAVKGGSGLDASTVLTRFVRDLAEGGPQTPAPVPQRSRY
jgi:DNA polymerase-3 subunit delta